MKTTHRFGSSIRSFTRLLGLLAWASISLNAAQTYTWNGGGNSTWLTPTHWSPNGIPGADDTAIINSGVPDLPGPSETLPHIQLNGGTLGGQGTVTTTMTWNGGLIRGVLSISNGATLTLTGVNVPHELTQGGTILNSGTITWNNGFLWRQSTDTSALPCSINNLPTGVLELTGDHQAYVVGAKPWTITNEGTVRKTAGTSIAKIEPTAYHNVGVTEVQTGTLQLGGPDSVSPGDFVAVNGAVLLWTSGGITDGATFSGLGEHQVRGGTLNGNLAGGRVAITGSVGGNAILSGTTILRTNAVLTGALQISGSLDWQAGTVQGTLTISPGASMQITTAANHDLSNGGTVNNGGNTVWSDGSFLRYSQDSSATFCSFNNLAGGTFEVTGNNSSTVAASKTWTFNNAGTVRKTAGTGLSIITPTAFNNTGLVEAQTGTLRIGGPDSVSPGALVAGTGAIVNWTTGGITSGASFTGAGEVQMIGGTLNGTLTGSSLVITGSVGGSATLNGSAQLRGGVVAGTLEITGTLEWESGRVDGTLNQPIGATMLITTAAYHELANGGTVNTAGHTIWSDGYLWRYSQDGSASACAFNNLAGGTFEITGNNSSTVAASKTWTFNNAGTVRKTAGTGLSIITPTAFNNTGVVEAQTGTLRIGGPDSVSPGAFMAGTGAIVNWTTGSITSGASFTGAGEVQMMGGTLNGTLTGTSLVITGSVGGSATLNGSAHLRGGVVAGTLEITGTLEWESGRVDGTLNQPAGATMLITTVGYHELANGGTVNTAGHTIWSDGYLWRYSQDGSASACAFNNLAGGVFEMTGNNSATIAASRPWSFNNAGTVRKTAGTGVSQITPTAFNNTGVVEAQIGTVRLGGTESSSSGSFVASSAAFISWISGNLTSGVTFTGAGENQVNGGTLNGTVSSSNLVITGSIGGHAAVSGTAKLRGGVIAGTVDMTGTLDWESGRMDGTLNITPTGTLLIRGNQTYHELANRGTVNNSGTTTWSDGLIFRTATDTSGLDCAFNNLAGGLFQITGNNSASLAGGNPWSFINSGTIQKVSSGTTTISVTAFTNAAPTALIDVDAGILNLGNFNQTAGTFWLEGGNVQCANLQIEGGVLKGARSIIGSVTQTGGQIQPGNGLGSMTITGTFNQSGTGVLFAELGGRTAGTGFDQLIVNGATTLAGGVSGSLVNGFAPMMGEEFAVIRYASRVGASAWSPFVADLSRKLTPLPLTTETRLVTGLSPMDFNKWAEATGLSGPDALMTADPDRDGLINLLEYGLYSTPLISDARVGQTPALTATQRGQITYNRIKEAMDLDIEVEASNDLVNWETIARSQQGAPTVDVAGKSFSISETEFPNYLTATVVDQIPLSPMQTKRFLRVRVTSH